MCQALERPQRRHRAMYLAPSVGQWHQQQQHFLRPTAGQGHDEAQQQQDENDLPPAPDSLSELGIPLLLEVPNASAPLPVSPPSSGEASSYEFQQQLPTPPLSTPQRTWMGHVTDAVFGMYHGFVDFFLLVVVCFMGCFFYDVEVKVVQAGRQRTRARGRSGRVIIRTNEQDRQEERGRSTMTSLLRTPPRSGNYSRASQSPHPREDAMWEHVV